MLVIGQELILPLEPACRVVITKLQREGNQIKQVYGMVLNGPEFFEQEQDLSLAFNIYECAAALIAQQLGYRPIYISIILLKSSNDVINLREGFGDFDAFEEVITRLYHSQY